MGRIDDNYFKTDKTMVNSIDDLLDKENDETILWRGKHKKSAYILNEFLKMFPIALIWILFDGFFISMFLVNADGLPPSMFIFLIIFFLIHLAPVWIWLSRVLTASRRHKNLEYAFTDKRIIIKSGIIGIDFKSIYYSDIVNVNLKVGIIDRMLHVGDIYINSHAGADVLFDIENPYFISEKLQKIVLDIKADISFPNNLRPENNDGYNTKYRK